MKMIKNWMLISLALLTIDNTNAQDIKTGITLLQYQRYNSAIENFNAVLQQKPDDETAAFWLTETYIKNKELDKAAAFLNSKAAWPENSQLLKISTAHLLIAQNKKAEAGKILSQKIFSDTTANKDEILCVALGRVYTDLAKFNLAESFYLRAHTLNPSSPYILVQLGQTSFKKADGTAAYQYYKRALEISPDYAAANFGLGKLFKAQNNPEVYLPYFKQVLAKDSLFAPAWYELYRYAYFNDKSKTRDYYNKYLETADKTEKQEFQLLIADYNNKNFNKVIAKGNAMLADKEADIPVEIYKYLAFSYYATKNIPLAYSNMIQYMEVQDTIKISSYDHYLMAQFAARIVKKDSAAIKMITAGFYNDTSSKNKYFYAAKLYNHYIEAKDAYNINLWKQRLLPFKNYNKADMYKVGLNWYDMNELEKADSVFSDFIIRYPDAYEGIYMKGAIQAKLDSTYSEGLALQYFTQFLDSTATTSQNYKTQIEQVYSYLGAYYLAKEDYNTALLYYQKLLDENPKDAGTQNAVNKIKKYLKDVRDYKNKSKNTK